MRRVTLGYSERGTGLHRPHNELRGGHASISGTSPRTGTGPPHVCGPRGGRAGRLLSPAGLAAALRRNWLFACLLAAGLVLRILTQLAYQPALLYIDSVKYLFGAYACNDPPGYQLMLKVFLGVGTLPMVAAVQHLLGLAMAVALYLILRRRGWPAGWPRWPPRRSCWTPTSCRSSSRSCPTPRSRRSSWPVWSACSGRRGRGPGWC